jgi:hypothetical protein
VVHYEGERLIDHCGEAFSATQGLQDDEGSVLFAGRQTVALLDDRDLAKFADEDRALQAIARSEVPARFRFVADPKPA